MRIRATALAIAAAVAALVVPAGAGAKPRVYVVGNGSSNVAALDIGATGSLTPVPGSPFAAGAKAVSIAMTPDGRRAYVVNASTVPPSVSAYNVTATGALVPIAGVFYVGALPLGNAVTPNGQFMYVNNRDSGDVSAFEIHGTGAMTVVPGSPFPVGGLPVGIAVSADGRSLYTQNLQGTVSALAIGADGTLGTIPGSPFASGGKEPFAGAVSPDGRFLYVANLGSNDISAFAIAPNGSLTPLAGFPVASGGGETNGIAVSPDGRRLYAMTSATVGSFAISPSGALEPLPSAPVPAGSPARSGAVTPDGTRLYVAAFTEGKSVLGFGIEPPGTLAPLAGSPFDVGISKPDVQALAIAPNQGPTASFGSSVGGTGTVAFDAAASSDPDGTVSRYDWDFGDGSGAADGGANPSHTYRVSGTYRVTLTVTDNEGCSTSVVYTGQTASCNGGSAARFQADLKVEVPSVRARKPKLKVRGARTQKLGKWIVVVATTDIRARLSAAGRLVVKSPARGARASKARRRSFKLAKRTAVAKPGKAKVLRLRVPKAARRAAARALSRGGRARAKLTVKASAAGKASKAKRTVRLRR
jgi:DNA-binding beta-propeller fold protein YncE